MNIKNIIKKQTTIIVVAVVLITITAIGVSYSVFFDVKNGQTQTIIAGDLNVTINTNKVTLAPMSNDSGKKLNGNQNLISYTVTNTNNSLPAKYKIYVKLESDTANVLNYINFSDEGNSSSGTNVKSLASLPHTTLINGVTGDFYLIVGNEGESDEDYKTIPVDTTNDTSYLRFWIDEDLLSGEINGKVTLSFYIVSEVNEREA